MMNRIEFMQAIMVAVASRPLVNGVNKWSPAGQAQEALEVAIAYHKAFEEFLSDESRKDRDFNHGR